MVDAPPIDFMNTKNLISSGTVKTIRLLYENFGNLDGLGKQQVNQILNEKIESWAMRDFVKMNIEFDDSDQAHWKCNFMAIHKNINNILNGLNVKG